VGTVVASTSFQLLNLDGTNPSAPGVITGSTGTWFRYDGTQTRATSLDLANGIYYKNGDHSRIYLGSIKVDEAGKFNDTSAGRRLLWNYFNRIQRNLIVQDTTSSWTTSTASYQPSHGTLANRVELMIGVAEDIITARVGQTVQCANGQGGGVGIGYSSITANSAQRTNNFLNSNTQNVQGLVTADMSIAAVLGYGYLQSLEYNQGAGSLTLLGGTGTAATNNYALEAEGAF